MTAMDMDPHEHYVMKHQHVVRMILCVWHHIVSAFTKLIYTQDDIAAWKT